jgi:hypothetical protein
LSRGEEKVALDKPLKEIWVDAASVGHLTWKIRRRIVSSVPNQSETLWVSATEGPSLVHRETNIFFESHHGQVTASVWSGSPVSIAATVEEPLAGVDATRASPLGGDAVSGETGLFSFASGGGSAELSARLVGPFFNVKDALNHDLVAKAAGDTSNDLKLQFKGTGDSELAQSSAFYWARVARTSAGIVSATELLNIPIYVNVNQACNAYWDGEALNFFRAQSDQAAKVKCVNTAYADIVIHEYGHAIDEAKGMILDASYSEGFGDALSILLTRQPCMGRDFRGPGTCLRQSDEVHMWPPKPHADPHDVGRIYSGFAWELMLELKKSHPENQAFNLALELVMAAAAANPKDIPGAVYLSFVADSTSKKLADCSPHFAELAAAADSRKIPRPQSCRSYAAQ